MDSVRVPLGGTRQELVLAALLLATGCVVTLQQLVQVVWETQPPSTAAHQIRKIVADLRRRLPPGLIVTDGPGYRMDVHDTAVDLKIFERQLVRARAAEDGGRPDEAIDALSTGLSLWRGDALSGMNGLTVRTAAARADERRLMTVERLITLQLEIGEEGDLVGQLRALAAEHPMRERLLVLLMTALYQAGRQAEALQVYADARQSLADQLGIDPGPELNRRHEQILRNDPVLDPRSATRASAPAARVVTSSNRPMTIPRDLVDFTGHVDTLESLVGYARPDATALTLVSINGMGGVGKTTLAIHAAHRLGKGFPDGQLFLDLHGFTYGREPVDPVEALGILLRAVGTPGEQLPTDQVGRSALWRAKTADRSLLILLDNASSAQQVLPLLPSSATSLVLITTRSRLNGLDGTHSITLDPPLDDEASAIVHRLLGDRHRATEAEVQALVEACGRLPLALRIAVARLHNRPKWTLGYLIGRLRREGRLMRELVLDDRSVAASIGLSYHGVGPDHQQMFRLIGMFPGESCDAYTAAALAGVPQERAEQILEDLLDSQLLIQRQLDRYEMHDLVRNFVRTVLAQDDDENATALHRLLDYYVVTAETAANRVQPGRFVTEARVRHPPQDVPPLDDQAEALEWFEAERRNLLAAIDLATDRGHDFHLCHLPRTMAFFLYVRGEMHEHVATFRNAAAAARRIDEPVHEGLNLINVAIAHWYLGEFTEALECYADALAIAQDTNDTVGEGTCLGRIGIVCASMGRFEEALSYQQRALAIHRTMGGLAEQGNALSNISQLQNVLGMHAEAVTSAREAVRLLDGRDQPADLASALTRLASAQSSLGEGTAALATLTLAAVPVQTTNSRRARAMLETRYAEVLMRLGRLAEAERHGLSALSLLGGLENPALRAEVENVLGRVSTERSDFTGALTRHRTAHENADRIGLRLEQARALDGMGRAHAGLGDLDQAMTDWQAALSLYRAMGVTGDDLEQHLGRLEQSRSAVAH
ncbi:BTAD domain-containing putative transcriptional regulator [Micromonospora sp. CA-248260]|uniref:AfsR/SARP family transcriptional regulator n=1 Tax=Micromonospora sp. CA-248260 TaxID=3239962 RepID=UPI003D8AD1CA